MRVVSLQIAATGAPKERNVERALALVDAAPRADLILLPELWTSGYFAFDRYRAESEALDGPTVEAFAERARERACYILMGSLVERAGERLYNTSVLLDPAGRIAARYRKIHLFGYESRERRLLTAGDALGVADTPWGRVGLATCYDLRFPELFRKMLDRGARMFLVASAWPSARLDAWRLFCRARAHENLAFLFSCNCAGVDAGPPYAGHSLLVDPLGRVLAEGGGDECVVSAEIDPGLIDATRKEFTALDDRIDLDAIRTDLDSKE